MNIRDSFICKTPIAHRGLHGDSPENSRTSFARAIDEGYVIETDVRLTNDGVPIILHDDRLTRLTGLNKKVIDCSYREIRGLRLTGTDERIMALEEFLDFIGGRTPLVLEVKDVPFHREFPETIIRKLESYKGEYAFQSFNPFYVYAFKRYAPHIPRGQVAVGIFSREVLVSCRDSFEDFGVSPEYFIKEGNLTRKELKNVIEEAVEECDFKSGHRHWKFDAWAIKTMIMNFITKPDFISYCCYNLPYHRVKKKKDCAILGWTVRTEEEARRITPWVDNIIFENIRPKTPLTII